MKSTLPKYKRYDVRGTIKDSRKVFSGARATIQKLSSLVIQSYHTQDAQYQIKGNHLVVYDFYTGSGQGYFEIYSFTNTGPKKAYFINPATGEERVEYCL